MRWLLALLLVLPGTLPTEQDSVYLRMKVAYCYTRFSAQSERIAGTPEVRERARANADSLFPRYQRAIEASKGTLSEVMLSTEAAKARTAEERDLSTAEFFMIQEACEGLLSTEQPPRR
jgi:hypothetical protein